MRSAIIFGHFALCALFIIVSGAPPVDYSLPNEYIELNKFESAFIKNLISQIRAEMIKPDIDDLKNPKSWRMVEKEFKDKKTDRMLGFDRKPFCGSEL